MKIYTLTGDDGTTSLSGGKRLPKSHPRVEAYGTVDELISWIGLLRDVNQDDNTRKALLFIQDKLMVSAAVLATDDPVSRIKPPDEGLLTFLEKEIDMMESDLPKLNSFILPGGNVVSSYTHIARSVCRRAERAVLRLKEKEQVPDIINKFLNRLSDYLFVLARKCGYDSGYKEVKWPVE
ncbi:MAG TPA: cob(I)yrinic acid a,c-diamide adenosyltransferase [Bacteroidales bacterium]|nr:cob(I)yrinic acid a,c-diamide adenosyltransferase [Bacteroidales bacterium]